MSRAVKTLAASLWAATLSWSLSVAWAAERVDPGDAFLEAVVEDLAEAPFEQEMVMLTVRGFYRANITRATLVQPQSGEFGWMQLGKDRWFDATVGGRQGRRYERRLAIFPQASGAIEIGAFRHQLSLLARNGTRFKHEVITEPLIIEVRPKPVGGDWWLPARAIRVTDSWSRPPDQLGFGQTAQRTVTLEADGVGPELLPPVPPMAGAGIIAFTDPEERTTELTPDGPVSRVTWRWTVKPSSDAIGTLEPLVIPWFDTLARESRELVLPGQRVALAAAHEEAEADEDGLPIDARILGLTAGFLFGLILLVPGRRIRSRSDLLTRLRRVLPDPEAWALRRAARRGDGRAVRRGAHSLLRRSGLPRGSRGQAVRAALDEIDRSLFAPARAPIDLRSQVRDFLAALSARRSPPPRP